MRLALLVLLAFPHFAEASCNKALQKTVFFVCGLSAVGKETLIRKVLDPQRSDVRARFGVDGREIVGTGPGFLGDEALFTSDAEVVFHKWQFASHHLLPQLKQEHPDWNFRVLLLWTPFQHNYDGFVQRSMAQVGVKHAWGWNDASPEAYRESWNLSILPQFAQLQAMGFEIELVDATTDDYVLRTELFRPLKLETR